MRLIRRALRLLAILLAVGVLVYGGIVAMVAWKAHSVPPMEDYDAIVVLGAQVKPDGSLSLQLQWRLDAAWDAWQKHNCLIVTCGAQGANEPAPEGQVMRDYLIARGVDEEMILVDVDSYNTRQNIDNAAQLLAARDARRVLIVTSDYHLPRAMALAEDAGLTASGLGARTLPVYWVKNYGREALSWVKYWGQKYLNLPLD